MPPRALTRRSAPCHVVHWLIKFFCNDTVRQPVVPSLSSSAGTARFERGSTVPNNCAAPPHPSADRPPPHIGRPADARPGRSRRWRLPHDRLECLQPARSTLRQRPASMCLQVAASLGYAGPDPAGRSLRRRRPAPSACCSPNSCRTRSPTRASCRSCRASRPNSAMPARRCCCCPPRAISSIHSCATHSSMDSSWPPSRPRDQAVVDVLQRRLPLSRGETCGFPAVPRIGIDNAKAAQLAGEHLVGLAPSTVRRHHLWRRQVATISHSAGRRRRRQRSTCPERIW